LTSNGLKVMKSGHEREPGLTEKVCKVKRRRKEKESEDGFFVWLNTGM